MTETSIAFRTRGCFLKIKRYYSKRKNFLFSAIIPRRSPTLGSIGLRSRVGFPHLVAELTSPTALLIEARFPQSPSPHRAGFFLIPLPYMIDR